MKICASCGHQDYDNVMRCSQCGQYYSKIIEMIDEIAKDEEGHTWRGRLKRIRASGNIRQALLDEWRQFWSTLTLQARFTLVVIGLFIFWMIAIVL